MDMSENRIQSFSLQGYLAAFWGVFGFMLILGCAINRLMPITLEALSYPISTLQWTLLLVNLVFMGYSEGYKGFQKSFSPRLAARARYLANNNATLSRTLLAPLFCMGFFHAPKRRIISSLLLSLMIIAFIFTFHLIPQPWRGILDAGVVFGLCWGLIATASYIIMAFGTPSFNIDPEVPSSASHTAG